MSLLMDALKKAEQEKRAAAKKLLSADDTAIQSNEAVASTSELHPPVNTDVSREIPAIDNPADKTYQRPAMDFSLAPLESRSAPATSAEQPEKVSLPLDSSEEPTLNVFLNELALQDKSREMPQLTEQDDNTDKIELGSPTAEAVALDPDQTFHGLELDMEKAVEGGLYEDTIQGEAFRPGDISSAYDETLPGVPAAQLARDIGTQDQPTPVAAQTVFTATQTVTKPSSGFRWLLVSLCVLMVGSAVVFYYYSVTPVARDIPSPMVARGVETVIYGQDLQNLIPAEIAAVADSMDISGTADSVVVVEDALVEPLPESVADVIVVTTIEEPQQVEQIPVTVDSISTTTAVLPAPAYIPPPVMQAPPAMIRISRSMRQADEGRLVSEAFAAYQRGDLDLAKTRYEQAYVQSPDNRDVLLGLAAIASKNGDTIRAIQLYTRLVRINPLDNVARAALLAFQQGDNVPASISSIKSMLFESPDQPSLYFSLGKLYAEQTRWSEAQQAFFDAYRLDSSNPDYALNLAVSLDRLGQSRSALDYYNAALQLAYTTPAGFDAVAVSERIRTLEARE
jgi:tetratricopeptide (TPR) repeat protein